VSCASAGNCTAVGAYSDSSLNTQGLLLNQSSGAWGTAVEASLPANANASPGVSLGPVSCASAGNCSAVGTYGDSSLGTQGLLVSESSGAWSTGVEATLPANANASPSVSLSSVSCASGGCSAVGTYPDSSLNTQGLLIDAFNPPSNSGPPTFSGTAQQGQTLSESHGSWTNNPTSFAYQWQDCDSSGTSCTAISGATNQTYTLQASDVGHTLRVQETATNAGGSSSPASSAQTSVVTPPVPLNVSVPTLSGVVQQGQLLSESHGSWTNGPTSFAYQWLDCDSSGNGCVAIAGATGQTYTLTAGDLGHTLRVSESATNAGGTGAPVSSAQSGAVVAPPVTAAAPSDQTLPQVTGTGTVGQVLSSSPGTWSGTTPIVFATQWQRCAPGCSSIAGATGSTYTLAPTDAGALVRVVVTATNSVGSAQASSIQVGPIATIAPVAPSAAQIKASLLRQLAPQGKAAKIAALLKQHGYVVSFTALSAGKLVIGWYYLPAGAHLTLAKPKPKPVLVATVNATFSQAGTQKLTITLTANGKQLLKHAKRLKLTAKGTFTPAGKSAIVATKNFTLTR
jgi:hypothetical protein